MVSFNSRISPRTSHRDFARQVAARDRSCHLRDVADLIRQIAAHGVDAVGQIFPCAGDAGHKRLSAELAFSPDLAGDPGHFGRERSKLIHHRIDGLLQLKDFAANIDGDLLGEVAVRDRDRHLRDVAHLTGQVARHRIDAFREIPPNAGHFAHLRLAAELPVGSDFASDAGHLRCKNAQLFDHRIDDLCRAEELALEGSPVYVKRDRLLEIALRHRSHCMGDGRRRPQEVVNQVIDGALHFTPGASSDAKLDAPARLAFLSDDLSDPLELLCHALICGNDVVEGVPDLAREPNLIGR